MKNVISILDIVSGPKQTQIIIDTREHLIPKQRFTIDDFIIRWDTKASIFSDLYPKDMINNIYVSPVVPFEKAFECKSDNICYILLENVVRDTCETIKYAFSSEPYTSILHVDEVSFVDSCWEFLLKKYPSRKNIFEIRKRVSHELHGN